MLTGAVLSVLLLASPGGASTVIVISVAGTGTAAYWGDGGLASTTTVDAPADVAVDSSGDVFIADTTDNRVRMVPASSGTFFGQVMVAGDIYTVAGTGTVCSTHTPAGCGYTSGGAAQLATSANLDAPSGVAIDSAGNLYIADKTDNMVAMVARAACSSSCPFGLASTTIGDIYAVAGTGTACSTHTPAGCLYNGAATSAKLDAPSGVAIDSVGNLFIADTTDNMVAMVARAACSSSCPFGLASTALGSIYAVAGTGTACSTHTPAGCLYNGAATSAKLDAPSGVATIRPGNLFIADTTDNMAAMVARVACSSSCPFGLASTALGSIYAVAGTGTACSTHTPAGCLYNAVATSADPGRALRCGHGCLGEPLHRRQDRQHGGHGGPGRLLVVVPVRTGLDRPGLHLRGGRDRDGVFDPHPRRVPVQRRGDLGRPWTPPRVWPQMPRETSTSPTPPTTWWRWWQPPPALASCPMQLSATTIGDIYAIAGTGTGDLHRGRWRCGDHHAQCPVGGGCGLVR